jgi:hypothetical protein
MPFRVQIGAEEVYIEDPACGGAGIDVPPEYERQIRGMAETHHRMREPSAYEEGLLLTFFILDFGHSGIDPLQIRQGRGDTVRKLGDVWWRGRHHEIAQPPMPLQ